MVSRQFTSLCKKINLESISSFKTNVFNKHVFVGTGQALLEFEETQETGEDSRDETGTNRFLAICLGADFQEWISKVAFTYI
jgi:hypothetical protein